MCIVCGCPWRTEEGMGSLGAGIQVVVIHPVWVLGTEGPLEEQQVALTTEHTVSPIAAFSS